MEKCAKGGHHNLFSPDGSSCCPKCYQGLQHNACWVQSANGMGDTWFEKEMEMIDEEV